MDKRITNILTLSLGFMLVFVSFQTMSNILITLVNSITADRGVNNYKGDAFYALAIVYVVLSLFNFVVPPIISVLGTRISMVLGAVGYALYIISFFITPESALVLYVASVILGIGAATIWTAQGAYLTLNSDAYTIARNSAIFWAAFQCSTLIGNTVVHFAFKNAADSTDAHSANREASEARIPYEVRVLIYSVLSGVCLIGVFVLMLLGAPVNADGEQVSDSSKTPSRAFTRAFALLGTKNMLLLCISFWFTGANLAFSASVYSSCIGFTEKFAERGVKPETLIGLSGILFGLGEVVGGSLFGVLAEKTTFAWGRNPIVILGSLVLLTSFTLIYLNLPFNAQFKSTPETSYFNPPIVWLAVLCSFLLGFGDSCFNTQIYSIVATIYRDDPAPSFALFKFVQSIASGIAFLYFKYVPLHILLIALAVMDILAAVTFFPVEREARTPHFEPDELHIQIPAGPSVNMVTAPKDD